MNKKIIDEFEGLVKQINYDLNNSKTNIEKNKNLYRLRQIKNAIKIIKKYKNKILSGDDLQDIKGIGKGIIRRINEILNKGFLSEVSLDNKKEDLNKIVNELEQVIGIGRKNAIHFASIGIKSVKDLYKKVKNKEIKVNDEIKLGLKYYKKYSTKIPRKEIDKINKYVQKVSKRVDKDLNLIICGSYRRGKLFSHDIDILLIHKKIKKLDQIVNNDNNYLIRFVEELKKDKFLLDDLTYKNYITKYMGFSQLRSKNTVNPIRRIDIRYFPYESYYTALLHFTGSSELNKEMRQKAIKLGYKLSEYGLFKNNKRIKIKSEKDIFEKLDIKYLEPYER